MPLRSFLNDVASLRETVAANSIDNISGVLDGNSKDEVVVLYNHEALDAPISVRILCGDIDTYPKMMCYFLSIDEPRAAKTYTSTLSRLQEQSAKQSLADMVNQMSLSLSSHIAHSSKTLEDENTSVIEISDDDESGDSNLNNEEEVFNVYFPIDGHAVSNSEVLAVTSPNTTDREAGGGTRDALRKRLSRDLRAVEDAGFHFGAIYGVNSDRDNCILSVSVSASEMDLPPEMLIAWDLDPAMYIVLLIRMRRGYMPFEDLLKMQPADTDTSFLIGKCAEYKPTPADADAAFVTSTPSSKDLPRQNGFSKIIVSGSLNRFMNSSFFYLARLRYSHGISWEEANVIFLNLEPASKRRKQSEMGYTSDNPIDLESASDPTSSVDEAKAEGEASFPLVAFRFALEQVARCTQYCQACHQKIDADFEALKPFVCPRPLCLFQYIQMRMGLSTEHEIVSQPKVVDLLVSFCYAALIPTSSGSFGIREFPVGLQLCILQQPTELTYPQGAVSAGTPGYPTTNAAMPVQGIYSYRDAQDAVFAVDRQGDMVFFKEGQWVAVHKHGNTAMQAVPTTGPGNGMAPTPYGGHSILYHATIKSIDFIRCTIHLNVGSCFENYCRDTRAELLRYTDDFDSVDTEHRKLRAMGYILESLPRISILKSYLDRHPYSSLRSIPGVSPSAATLLEWIIATNKSCILQIEDPALRLYEDKALAAPMNMYNARHPHTTNPVVATSGQTSQPNIHTPKLEAISWVQFCFYQGSPSDDIRFRHALNEVAKRNGTSTYPTIWGWHGSRLQNWHSILRTGLDYRRVSNGRSFGDGVYFSNNFGTSLGYSGSSVGAWPNSDLHVASAISLNEIINAPQEFQSCIPHYVVGQRDWHQCRFLLVKANGVSATGPLSPSNSDPAASSTISTAQGSATSTPSGAGSGAGSSILDRFRSRRNHSTTNEEPSPYFQQDPSRIAYGPSRHAVVVPMASLPGKRTGEKKKSRALGFQKHRPSVSVDSDVGVLLKDSTDLAALYPDDGYVYRRSDAKEIISEPALPAVKGKEKDEVATGNSQDVEAVPSQGVVDLQVTKFEPGTLDLYTLPRLPTPGWVTAQAQKTLSREVQRMVAVQSATPQAELGWYIDFDKLDNLFQWIVEMHSFDLSLPLAADMVKNNVQSIVFELRFGESFPYSPPFVRVIRPRFLPFSMGGGGHVTGGGAMCMELLTNSGWSPVNQIDAVLLQVRLALCNLEPVPARLCPTMKHDYSIAEAHDAYLRVARAHGWEVPKSLNDLVNFSTQP